MGRVSFATASLLAATATASNLGRMAIPKGQDNTTETLPTFQEITPSAELEWHDCFEPGKNLQCARLTVPLDYEDEAAGTTDIAYIRYLLDEDAPDMIFNPGGPGESGIEFASTTAELYAKRWRHNFVTFDPRGVKRTGPRVSCKATDSASNQTVSRRDSPLKGIDTLKNLKTKWDETSKLNTACSEYNKDTDAKYVGTLANVQDMMHFTELQAGLRGQDPKEAIINYYGISYGTLMGQTLVAAFPDRVGKVLLDANVYGVAHYQGWEPSGIDDFSHALWMFNKLCFEAGPDVCALAEGMNSIDETKARFDAVIAGLYKEPLDIGGTPIDGNDFLGWLTTQMYTPRGAQYNNIVNATLAVESGDLSFFEEQLAVAQNQKRALDSEEPEKTGDELNIITATDIAGRFPWKTFEDFEAVTKKLASTAEYYAFQYASSNG